MKEAIAVVGYVASDVAKRLSSKDSKYTDKIEVRVGQGSDELLVRVDPSHVVEVRTGASSKGETGIQLILRDAADVETVTRATLNKQGIARLRDPLLSFPIIRPPYTVIYV